MIKPDLTDTPLDKPVSGKRALKREQKRLAILNAAFDIFSRDGFENARILDVARAAKVAKGTVYLYFESKTELFKGVVVHKMLPVVNELKSFEADADTSCAEVLRRQIRFVYYAIVKSERRQIIRMILTEGVKFPDLAKFYYEFGLSRGIRSIETTLARGVENGEFKPDLDVPYPMLFMSPAIAAGLWTLVFQDLHPIDVDAYCDAHIDFVLNAVLPDDGT